jgi:hypothetical protein
MPSARRVHFLPKLHLFTSPSKWEASIPFLQTPHSARLRCIYIQWLIAASVCIYICIVYTDGGDIRHTLDLSGTREIARSVKNMVSQSRKSRLCFPNRC